MIKREFAACAIGMDLPVGHTLRDQLGSCKRDFEDLLEQFLSSTNTENKKIWGYPPKKMTSFLDFNPRLKTATDEDLETYTQRAQEKAWFHDQNWETLYGVLYQI